MRRPFTNEDRRRYRAFIAETEQKMSISPLCGEWRWTKNIKTVYIKMLRDYRGIGLYKKGNEYILKNAWFFTVLQKNTQGVCDGRPSQDGTDKFVIGTDCEIVREEN